MLYDLSKIKADQLAHQHSLVSTVVFLFLDREIYLVSIYEMSRLGSLYERADWHESYLIGNQEERVSRDNADFCRMSLLSQCLHYCHGVSFNKNLLREIIICEKSFKNNAHIQTALCTAITIKSCHRKRTV